MGAYDRIVWRGHTFDKKTVAGILHMETFVGGEVPIDQGSYNGGPGAVSASAGTHDGGGAVDFDNGPFSYERIVWAGRCAGFAIYHRLYLPGEWQEHAHAIQIGNAAASDAAKRQVDDYRHHLNGLAGHAADREWFPPGNVVPFRYPLGRVRLDVAHDEAVKKSGWTRRPSVVLVQRTLNLKTDAGLAADGIFGPKTRKAYAHWESLVGGDGDGIPGIYALRLLGGARFNIKNAA